MSRREHDAVALEFEVDGRPRHQPSPLAYLFGDYDLSLGADTMSHTWSV